MQTGIPDVLTPDELGFSPPMCYIQGRSSDGEPGAFTVQMKFRPTPETLASCVTYVDPNGKGDNTVIIIPLYITVPGQTLKVLFRLRAKITSSDVIFDPPSLDFGPCFTDRSVAYPLKITNTSALPQRFGFVKLPREVSVPFQDGFGTLLPFETIEREVIFSPSSATMHNFSLTFSTYLNRTFKLPCRGRGVTPLLSFSHSLLKLACAPKEEKVEESVFVKNTTSHTQTFEFGVPALALAGITISPTCAVLGAGKSTRVEIVFTPACIDVAKLNKGAFGDEGAVATDAANSKEDFEEKEDGDGEDAADAEQPAAVEVEVPELELRMPPSHEVTFDRANPPVQGEDGEPTTPPEAQSMHATWRIPCFVKETGARKVPRSPRSARAAKLLQPTLCLEVHTTTLSKRKLIAQVPADTQSSLPKSLPMRLDFGQMAVGQEEIAPIRITNAHDAAVMLRCLQGPNVQGPFSLVNALRPLAPAGGTASGFTGGNGGGIGSILGQDLDKDNMLLYVRFKPEDQLVYCERISFQTSAGTASVTLAGQGVSPILELSPAVSC
jgi:hypothetical protein